MVDREEKGADLGGLTLLNNSTHSLRAGAGLRGCAKAGKKATASGKHPHLQDLPHRASQRGRASDNKGHHESMIGLESGERKNDCGLVLMGLGPEL
jgi:hypothetical protein